MKKNKDTGLLFEARVQAYTQDVLIDIRHVHLSGTHGGGWPNAMGYSSPIESRIYFQNSFQFQQ